MFPSKSRFSVENIADLSGKVVAIVALEKRRSRSEHISPGPRDLLVPKRPQEPPKKNAKAYMAPRPRTRAEEAIEDIEAKTGKRAIFLELDLASLDSITKAAREFQRQEGVLDVLFNFAGIMKHPIDDLTADGYDLQFDVNCLSHAHFTLLLLPQLITAAKLSTDAKACVVNVSSNAAYGAGRVGIYFDAMTDTPRCRAIGVGLYGISKYGSIVFSNELAKRIYYYNTRLQYGALTPLWAGTSLETKDFNGKWLVPWVRIGKLGPSKDPKIGEKLWDWIEAQRK
ncbi:hypothetical protein FRB97_003814, partial [Tulasnella sp. 331]